MKKNITMRDIASKMNISAVTVSKALSEKDGVSEKLREEIKAVAEQMGYRKNALAKDMKEGITHNIGILIPERYTKDNGVYNLCHQRICKTLMKNNYYGIMEVITKDMERLLTMPKLIMDSKVDGVIIMGQMKPDYVHEISEHVGIPYILFDFYFENLASDAVIGDNLHGGCALASHLIALGHRRIGFIGNILANGSVMERFLGYYKALLENGITFRRDWIIDDKNDFDENIEMALPEDLPTAFVAGSDESAYRIIDTLKHKDISVPEDISVVAFGDSLYALLAQPQLTSFSIDMEQMSDAAAEGIVNKLKNPESEFGKKTIGGKLIIRQSAARRSKSTWKDFKRFG